jgi:large subunit ribosomal protein L25
MIPEKIDLDVTNLDIGDSIHANEISIPGVKILEHLDVAIVTIIPPSGGEEKAVTAEAVEGEKKEE